MKNTDSKNSLEELNKKFIDNNYKYQSTMGYSKSFKIGLLLYYLLPLPIYFIISLSNLSSCFSLFSDVSCSSNGIPTPYIILYFIMPIIIIIIKKDKSSIKHLLEALIIFYFLTQYIQPHFLFTNKESPEKRKKEIDINRIESQIDKEALNYAQSNNCNLDIIYEKNRNNIHAAIWKCNEDILFFEEKNEICKYDLSPDGEIKNPKKCLYEKAIYKKINNLKEEYQKDLYYHRNSTIYIALKAKNKNEVLEKYAEQLFYYVQNNLQVKLYYNDNFDDIKTDYDKLFLIYDDINTIFNPNTENSFLDINTFPDNVKTIWKEKKQIKIELDAHIHYEDFLKELEKLKDSNEKDK